MLVDFFSRAMVMGFSCYIPSVGGVHGGTVDRSSVGGGLISHTMLRRVLLVLSFRFQVERFHMSYRGPVYTPVEIFRHDEMFS